MSRIRKVALALAGAVLTTSAASAGSPVALIEEMSGNPAALEVMEYLEPGRIIGLSARQTIVVSYLNSCTRETITGGTVTVGAEQSEVLSGKVERTKVRCDRGKASLSGELAVQIAGRAFRGLTPVHEVAPIPHINEPTVYGLAPMLEVRSPGVLVIERLDRPDPAYAIYIDQEQLVRGYYDFARWGKTLVAGGTYRAAAGANEIVFKVDLEAKDGRVPILSRLVRLSN
jgi:hypothetical protein